MQGVQVKNRNVLALALLAVVALIYNNCGGNFQATSAEQSEQVASSGIPTVSMMASHASLSPGESTTISWTSINATSCTASNAWTGPQPVSGEIEIVPAATSTYSLQCTNSLGSSSVQSITIEVADATPTPTPTSPTATPPGGGGTPTPTPPPFTGNTVEYFGRFDYSDPLGPKYSWSGSSMKVTFKGAAVTATLTNSENYYYVLVDQQTPLRMHIMSGSNQKVTLATGLNATQVHQVTLFKDNETSTGGGQFLGFSVDGGALLVKGTTKTYPLRIEFLGDAVSCGGYDYSDASTGACPATETSLRIPWESAYWGLAQQTANMLGTPPATDTCESRMGISAGEGGANLNSYYPTLGFYSYASIRYDFSTQPAPDVVVIAAGTMDYFSGPGGQAPSDFVTKYETLIATVRSHYPNAQIFCVTGPQYPGGAFAAAVKTVVAYENNTKNDVKVHYVGLGAIASGETCFGRPTKPAITTSATQLTAAIKQVLGLP